MTGYGRGEVEAGGQKWVVELRSLNHRFLEISLNLPRHLWALEDRVRKLLKSRISRGRVEVQLNWEGKTERLVTVQLDQNLVEEIRALLEDLEARTEVTEPLRLEHFLHFSDLLVTRERPTPDVEETWTLLSEALTQALEALEAMRRGEGEALGKEMVQLLAGIRQETDRIHSQAELLPQLWQKKLWSRLEEITLGSVELDPNRLAQEVALLAERRDLAEELTRLASHVNQFQEFLEEQGPVGRKLEFLLQEVLREINTIGAKAGDLEISQAVLEVKGSLERLREQVQNIE